MNKFVIFSVVFWLLLLLSSIRGKWQVNSPQNFPARFSFEIFPVASSAESLVSIIPELITDIYASPTFPPDDSNSVSSDDEKEMYCFTEDE